MSERLIDKPHFQVSAQRTRYSSRALLTVIACITVWLLQETSRFAICSLGTNCPFRISDYEYETWPVCQISLRNEVQTHASAVSLWLCLAGDGCASYPLAATVWSKFLPLVVPPIPRGNKKPVPSPSSAVLRPNKPTPKSIPFWGPRGVRRVNTPALKQPSRPR